MIRTTLTAPEPGPARQQRTTADHERPAQGRVIPIEGVSKRGRRFVGFAAPADGDTEALWDAVRAWRGLA